jgi:plastocyanin
MRGMLIALAVAAVVIAGCGGDDNESAATATPKATQQSSSGGGGGGGKTVAVSAPADGSLKFDQSTLSAKTGKVTFKFANPSSVPHAFEVEGNGVEGKTDTITSSDASVTVDLKPGKYEYFCPVDGHKAAGMEGTLTVK